MKKKYSFWVNARVVVEVEGTAEEHQSIEQAIIAGDVDAQNHYSAHRLLTDNMIESDLEADRSELMNLTHHP